jgi:hypothetical protein
MFKGNFKRLIKILQKVFFIGLLSITSTALADEQTRVNLAKHYSPIIYQHVDTEGEHGLGGRSDQIMNFDYDGSWRGDVKWESLESNVGTSCVYYSVVESANYWFIYYAIYHPRDWSKIAEHITMHENDMEAVELLVAKGTGYPGNLLSAISMAHNAWVEYPIEPSVTASNYDGTTDPNGDGVTFIQNKSVPDFISNGDHPRIYVQSRGHGVFMDADSNMYLQFGNAMGIDNWNLTGFPKLLDYNGTGLVYYCGSDDQGETLYNIGDKLIDSGGDHDGSPDIYGSRWLKYELKPMSELWDKREWKKDNQSGYEWMFVVAETGRTAFFGPSPGNNEAHPPWSMPDYPTYDDPFNQHDITSPGSIFYDPLTAFKQHFNGLSISPDEQYIYNPYYAFGEVKKLIAGDGAAYDEYGIAVSISGNALVVGAHWDDDNGNQSGSVYVYRFNGSFWVEAAKLLAPDGEGADWFGHSVAISGDTVLVGAHGNDVIGSAYIFARNQGGMNNWGFVKKITPSDVDNAGDFGFSVAIDGDTILVGAPLSYNGSGELSGSAHVFERDHGGADNWGEMKKIEPADGDLWDRFGYSVSISGNTIVAGARTDDDNGSNSGSAYIYERDRGGADNWGLVKKIIAGDGESYDEFGYSVSLSDSTIVVGASKDYYGGSNVGSAYIFERDQGGADNWGEMKKIIAGDPDIGDHFGYSVGISGDSVLIGAYLDDDSAYNSGSAYIFERDHGGIDNWGEVKKITPPGNDTWVEYGNSVAIDNSTIVVGAHQDNDTGDDAGAAYVYQDTGLCQCDFEPAAGDGDVDGTDLAAYMVDDGGISLSAFAAEFGRTDCP